MPAILEVNYFNSFWLKKVVDCTAEIDVTVANSGGPIAIDANNNPLFGRPVFPGIFPLTGGGG